MEGYSIRPAVQEDTQELVKLINLAYRGGVSAGGWTSEEAYLDGARTEANLVASQLRQSDAVFLKCVANDGRIAGCVFLELDGDHLHLGTFAIAPDLQSAGLGRVILDWAVEYAREKGCDRIMITVVNTRTELIAWYERRGYVKTGKRIPFPAHFGQPRFGVDFIEMEKLV